MAIAARSCICSSRGAWVSCRISINPSQVTPGSARIAALAVWLAAPVKNISTNKIQVSFGCPAMANTVANCLRKSSKGCEPSVMCSKHSAWQPEKGFKALDGIIRGLGAYTPSVPGDEAGSRGVGADPGGVDWWVYCGGGVGWQARTEGSGRLWKRDGGRLACPVSEYGDWLLNPGGGVGGPPMIECDMARVSTTYEIKMKIWLTMVSTIAQLIQTRSELVQLMKLK